MTIRSSLKPSTSFLFLYFEKKFVAFIKQSKLNRLKLQH